MSLLPKPIIDKLLQDIANNPHLLDHQRVRAMQNFIEAMGPTVKGPDMSLGAAGAGAVVANQIHRSSPNLPPWAFTNHDGRLTPAGALYMRFAWRQSVNNSFERRPFGLFTIKGLTIIDVVTLEGKGLVVVFAVLGTDKAIIIEDSVELFPSDELMLKMKALQP